MPRSALNHRKSAMLTSALAVAVLLTGMRQPAPADEQDSPTTSAGQVEALAAFRDLVGSWRGVGQPQRGSTRGAWVERGQWQWRFDDDRAVLAFDSPQGKLIRAAELRPADEPQEFVLAIRAPDSEIPAEDTASDKPAASAAAADKLVEIIYRGQPDETGRLVVSTDDPPEGLPARITIALVASGDRLVMLLERKAPAGERYFRLAEVGYTREGSQFGKGTTQPECVVTGGHASIAVEHQGRTYYVCCGGCRDLFNDDPDKTLAEYRQRKAAERESAEEQSSEN